MISCFETIEFRDSYFFALDAHLERLQRSASKLELPEPDMHAIGDVLDRVREQPVDSPAKLRLSWNDSGRVTLVSAPLTIPDRPAALALDGIPRVLSCSVPAGTKSSFYGSATAFTAAHPPADEVLMINEQLTVCGGAYSNIFVVKKGSVITPSLSSGCRNGVTRALLIKHLPEAGINVHDGSLSTDDVLGADEVFLCSTGRHVQEVGTIDDRPMLPDRTTTRLVARIFENLHNDPVMWS